MAAVLAVGPMGPGEVVDVVGAVKLATKGAPGILAIDMADAINKRFAGLESIAMNVNDMICVGAPNVFKGLWFAKDMTGTNPQNRRLGWLDPIPRHRRSAIAVAFCVIAFWRILAGLVQIWRRGRAAVIAHPQIPGCV